jgi:hypothetical protein
MENTKKDLALVKSETNVPAFIADATQSMEKMEAYANMLINSGLVPKHFYELDQYRNPIKGPDGKFKGNTAAVILTIQHGLEVGMSITQSLQQIVPINGVVSVKGDGAMALIQNSGLCVSWVEEVSGSIEKEDYAIKITAKHKNGRVKIIEFGVPDAKRLGLWVTPDMVAKNDKLKHGGWWKVPKRMINYRALGFMARDLFPEVMQGMYIEEEARDFNNDNTEMTTTDGMKVNISGEGAGNSLQDKVAETVVVSSAAPKVAKKAKEVAKPSIDAEDANIVEEPEPQQEQQPTQEANLPTIDQLKEMSGPELLIQATKEVGYDVNLRYFNDNREKRNKSKILEFITAHRNGTVNDFINAEFVPPLTAPTKEVSEPIIEAGTDYGYGDAPRDFDAKLGLFDVLGEKDIDSDNIVAYIKEKGLNYKDSEDFLENASQDVIHQLITSNA